MRAIDKTYVNKLNYMKTEQEQLDYINKEFNTNFSSLEDVDWVYISKNNKLSESFMREFQDDIDWFWVSIKQTLSEDFIREFQDEVDWYSISEYQKLSEDFIREFKDEVDWYCISQKQTLSKEFLREFKDMIAWDIFLCREDMRDILIDKMIN